MEAKNSLPHVRLFQWNHEPRSDSHIDPSYLARVLFRNAPTYLHTNRNVSSEPHHGGRSPSPARCFMSSPGAVAVLLDVDVHQGLDALQTRVTGCPRRQRNGRDLQVLLRRVQTVLINFLWLGRHSTLLREARLGHQMLLALARV